MRAARELEQPARKSAMYTEGRLSVHSTRTNSACQKLLLTPPSQSETSPAETLAASSLSVAVTQLLQVPVQLPCCCTCSAHASL
jgi:hypothetical protein